MAYREMHCVEITEIVRRWQAGLSQRRIARGTGLSRVTMRRYVEPRSGVADYGAAVSEGAMLPRWASGRR